MYVNKDAFEELIKEEGVIENGRELLNRRMKDDVLKEMERTSVKMSNVDQNLYLEMLNKIEGDILEINKLYDPEAGKGREVN